MYKIFCFVVMFIQLIIAMLNYYIYQVHESDERPMHATADLLCGISWTITALYWGWCGFTA